MIFFPISHFIVIFAPKFITDMDLFDRISADIKSALLAKARGPTALLLMMQP